MDDFNETKLEELETLVQDLESKVISIEGGIRQTLTELDDSLRSHRHRGQDNTTKLLTPTFYHGKVSDTGVADTVVFPSGWTAVKNSAGDYTVTHGLGTTNYSLQVTGGTVGNSFVFIEDLGSDSFRVYSLSDSGGQVDTEFNFLIAID